MDIIKVAGSSRTSAVAGAVAGVFREHHRAEVQAIGAGAVNQAVKAIVLASSYLRNDGYSIAMMPRFADVDIEGKIRTAVRFYVVEFEGQFSPDEPEQPVAPEQAPGEPPDLPPDETSEPQAALPPAEVSEMDDDMLPDETSEPDTGLPPEDVPETDDDMPPEETLQPDDDMPMDVSPDEEADLPTDESSEGSRQDQPWGRPKEPHPEEFWGKPHEEPPHQPRDPFRDPEEEEPPDSDRVF